MMNVVKQAEPVRTMADFWETRPSLEYFQETSVKQRLK